MELEWTEEGRARFEQRLGALPPEEGVPTHRRRSALVQANLRARDCQRVTPADVDAAFDEVLAREPWRRRWQREEGSASAALWFRLVCVLAPALVLAFELLTRACREMFFDPVPTSGHALALAGVSVAGYLGVRAQADSASPAFRRRAAFALGLALPVTAAYFVAFLPLAPLALMGVLYFGLGLLPLAPVVCFPSLLWLTVRVVRKAHARAVPLQRIGWAGVAVCVLLFTLAETQPWLTLRWARNALEQRGAERALALERLRSFGSERTLAALASGNSSEAAGPLWLLRLVQTSLAPHEGRALWFRVFGTEFQAPTQRAAFFGDWDNEWTEDVRQGGAVVGPELSGLELVSSRLDAALDAEAGVAYVEWILEVENHYEWSGSEARALVELPDEAVVSRATLWVGDEEREAAYAGTGAVRAAYETVVLVQRLDPLLVTSAGDDHVLAQVFPVPRGETRRWKLGFTIPLAVTDGAARLTWPRLVARNFALAPGLTHSLWVQSPERILEGALAVAETGAGWEARGEPAAEDPTGTRRPPALGLERRGATSVACAFDDEQELVCRFLPRTAAPRAEPVVVVNGSAALLPHVAELERGLATLTRPAFVSTDAGFVERTPDGTSRLAGIAFEGGMDDIPALEAAWDLARKLGTDVLWFSGPQPELLEPVEGLEQRFARAPDGPRLVRVALAPGENAVAAALARAPEVEFLAAEGVEDGLARLRGADELERAWSLEPRGGGQREGPRHLRALWASSEIERILRTAPRETPRALELAAREHLVTRVSGAVVLETAQQFAEHGLDPVEARALPSVPEPEEWLLLVVGAGALAFALVLARRGRAT